MANEQLLTTDINPTANTMIKAGELIDIIELTPTTLTDKKIYNQLIDNAGKDITQAIEHSIEKSVLRGSRRGTERVDDSINRLMGTIAKIRTTKDGEPATIKVQLLGKTTEHDKKDGNIYYSFDPILREALAHSSIFARLTKDVMNEFQSKYGLALYEIAEKRKNMRNKSEEFTIEEFRGYLGVPKGTLKEWYSLNNRALQPAQAEVNQLAPTFRVKVTGLKKGKGKAFTHILLEWWSTSPDGHDASMRELTYSKEGRKARRNGTVETLVEDQQTKLSHLLSDTAIESARKILINRGYREGWQQASIIWEEAFKNKPVPENPNGAFIQFCKKMTISN